jgi:hypothetical protein
MANNMNTHETMLEQIRRLNEQEAVKHELKKQEAINKIKELRRAQREQLQPTSDSVRL